MEEQGPTVTEEEVREALKQVIDPELGLDFVELGLIYAIEVKDGEVFVKFSLTTPGCPIGDQIAEQIIEFAGALPGVKGVHPKLVFTPAWNVDMMDEDAKFALGF